MSDKWEELLRKKLENYEVDPPPGLWEGICEQMDKPFRLKPLSRLTGTAQRWAAAAAVLALVGCFVVYEMYDREQPLQTEAVSQQQTSLLPSSEPVLAKQSPSRQQEDIVRPRQTNQGDSSLIQALPQNQVTCPLDSVTKELAQQQEEETVEPQQQSSPAKTSEYKVHTDIVSSAAYETPASQAKWSVALKASGGLLAANNSMRTEIRDEIAYIGNSSSSQVKYSDDNHFYDKFYSLIGYEVDNVDDEQTLLPISDTPSPTFNTVTEYYTAKHHLPLRLGLSLQYQLNPRLALLSGISYTRLSSEFNISQHRNVSYTQWLHYIGIPFGVAWQLWKVNRFSFYCSGGVMVEKCVSVDLDGGYSGTKPWQWSFNAAAGAEFSFTSQFGVYLEPSLGYYFSDGTQLEHYYKEHPLAPSIEFGLRMHLGR